MVEPTPILFLLPGLPVRPFSNVSQQLFLQLEGRPASCSRLRRWIRRHRRFLLAPSVSECRLVDASF